MFLRLGFFEFGISFQQQIPRRPNCELYSFFSLYDCRTDRIHRTLSKTLLIWLPL